MNLENHSHWITSLYLHTYFVNKTFPPECSLNKFSTWSVEYKIDSQENFPIILGILNRIYIEPFVNSLTNSIIVNKFITITFALCQNKSSLPHYHLSKLIGSIYPNAVVTSTQSCFKFIDILKIVYVKNIKFSQLPNAFIKQFSNKFSVVCHPIHWFHRWLHFNGLPNNQVWILHRMKYVASGVLNIIQFIPKCLRTNPPQTNPNNLSSNQSVQRIGEHTECISV